MSAQLPDTSVARDGFLLYYRATGSGTPVLLLSGGPGLDCDYMTPVAAEIAKSHRAILVEMRGTGRSLPKTPAYSLKAHLDDLEALRAYLKLERWSILAHSAGAAIALHYAVANPSRVESLVLVAAAPLAAAYADGIDDNINVRLDPQTRAQLQAGNLTMAEMVKRQIPAFFFDPQQAAAEAGVFRAESLHPEVNFALGPEMLGPGVDLRPRLKDFARPVLFIYGRQDPLDPRIAFENHLALKTSTLKFLNKCGHFPWVEQPQEFYQLVKGFLSALYRC